MQKLVLFCVATAMILLPQTTFAQKPSKQEKKQAEKRLEDLMMNMRFVSKVLFPATADGIDLHLDGSWNQTDTGRRVKDKGIGIRVEDPVVVTDTHLKDKHLEVHLNGGGKGTFGDYMTGADAKEFGALQSGGSRINLRFDRYIRLDDIEPEKLGDWLKPLLDTTSLQAVATLEALPEEFREAAERGEVVVEMTKRMVFAILGEPANKLVNLEVSPPIEKWQYETEAFEMIVLTFEAGRVAKIDRY